VVICQSCDVDAHRLEAADALDRATDISPRLSDWRLFFNERTLKVRDNETGRVKNWGKVAEQARSVATGKEILIAADGADVSATRIVVSIG